jgi:hypothetical protein
MSTSSPQVLIDYVSSLVDHDLDGIAATLAEDLIFVSATRILDKQQFIAMLSALYAGFRDWNHGHEGIEGRSEGNYVGSGLGGRWGQALVFARSFSACFINLLTLDTDSPISCAICVIVMPLSVCARYNASARL